ncbi:diguanylate cyclase [Roseicitreum antarcticum]|uniref:diguanylate cyclase n=1 Tax=Roseicitreum antarcticum TaxID=564137 RepID=UPI0015A04A68|nr:diguanylate cyclase [Roseicitreum antarcticum]
MTQTLSQSVLLVDDSPDIHLLVPARLGSERLTIHHAYNAVDGLSDAKTHQPDLILLDLDMPDIDGLTLCAQLKADKDLVGIPVIFLTGILDVATKVKAFELGAIDYVTKPFDGVELKARVRSALRTKRYHDMLSTKAQIDALTGLWNRRYLDDHLGAEVSALRRRPGALSLLMVDIDHFKHINDTYGHPVGDSVIQEVAEEIKQMSRKSDIVCRYGGEEFAVILKDTDSADALIIAERLREKIFMRDFSDGRKKLRVTVSIGIASSDQLAPDMVLPGAIIEAADRTLYRAKTEGRNRICFQAHSAQGITSGLSWH